MQLGDTFYLFPTSWRRYMAKTTQTLAKLHASVSLLLCLMRLGFVQLVSLFFFVVASQGGNDGAYVIVWSLHEADDISNSGRLLWALSITCTVHVTLKVVVRVAGVQSS